MRNQTEVSLRKATYQKANLGDRTVAALLTDIDAAQVDAQVAVLTDAVTQIMARKSALPA